MSPQLEVDKQPKRTIVLGKHWFHATKPDPEMRKNSSMPGVREEKEVDFNSYLYDPNINGKCCVGVYLGACGVPDDKLANYQFVNSIDELPKEAQWLLLKNTNEFQDAYMLYGANDGDTEVIEEFRGKKMSKKAFLKTQRAVIRKIFARHNVKVIFK